MNFKFATINIFTIFLPFLSLFLSVLLVLIFLISPNLRLEAQLLKVDITDGQFDSTEEIAFFNNQKINAPKEALSISRFLSNRVLSAIDEKSDDEKWIEIDLTKQRLYAHDRDIIVYEFPISSGKWGATPTGNFRIWAKLKYTLMHGGSKNDNTYYYLPNVPYTQYFYKGFGLHGTYWHNNFGEPMSHGCINMYTPDSETIFYWTSPSVPVDKWIIYPTKTSLGTRVVIHGVASQS